MYDELRRLPADRLGHEHADPSLNATSSVHEAYLRLVTGQIAGWEGKRHFFAAAAEAMRRILLNRARDRKRLKRGGDCKRPELSCVTIALDTPGEWLLELDEVLRLLHAEFTEAGRTR
ncbi:ECF-type sigma factor [Planctomycetaceae bacterium SH139]